MEDQGRAREEPTVGIGMPVFNAERFLERALESLLTQTFEDFSLLISDNGSTDRTEEICRRFAAVDKRITYVRQRKNYGPIHNFNACFGLSGGRYFKWAAADDICAPTYLEKAVEVLDSDPTVVLVWGKTIGIDEHENRVPMIYEVSDLNSETSVYSSDPTVRFRRLLQNIFWADGPFYGIIRSEVLAGTRALHPQHMSGDQILLAELSLEGRFYEIPEELFFSRVHAKKTSHSQKTLRDRAKLVDQQAPRRGLLGWWQMLRGYPLRLVHYARMVTRSRLGPRQKLTCYLEIVRAVASWGSLRARQLTGGRSPWK